MYQHTTISKKHQSQTLPPPEPLFSLNFNLNFLEFVIITIWRTIFPKFTTFVFPIDFLVCHFFFLHPARPSLPRCLWLFLPGGAPTRWGREREVYQASELCLFLFFGKTNGKTFGEKIRNLRIFEHVLFFVFFPNIFFIFGKTMENTSCSPLMPTFPPGNAALRDWFPPHCRPYFNGGWHDPKWRPVASPGFGGTLNWSKKERILVAEFGSEVYLKITRKQYI